LYVLPALRYLVTILKAAQNYTVPIPGGQKQLLNNVFGYVKPGTLTALMGASGAGKTTLLDVLAARKNIGVINGDILIGAKPVDVSFARGCAYAEQQVSSRSPLVLHSSCSKTVTSSAAWRIV